jgi:hypothetical protein
MPASERQIEANRRNAVRHGLTSHLHVVLEGEDHLFFEELRDSLLADYTPATTQETILVHQIAEHYWRLLRARNMETASLSASTQAFEIEFNMPAEGQPGADPSHVALAYSQHNKLFARLGRYETTIERSYYRAIRELQKLQSNRIRSVSQNQTLPEIHAEQILQPPVVSEPITNKPAPTEIRSVSQSPETTARALAEAWQMARITMSNEGLDQLLDQLTAPPAPGAGAPETPIYFPE